MSCDDWCCDPLAAISEIACCSCCEEGTSGPILPTDFPELRSWWPIENAPANGSLVDSVWPPVAGSQLVNQIAASTVNRSGTVYPDGNYGVRTGFKSENFNWAYDIVSNVPWVTTDGCLTMFSVSRMAATNGLVLGAMGPLGNPNSGATNAMIYASLFASALASQKDQGLTANQLLIVVSAVECAARLDQAFAIVSTYSPTDMQTDVIFEDGTIFSGTQPLASNSIVNAGGYTLNRLGSIAFPLVWNYPTVDAGVIGNALSQDDRLALAAGLLQNRGFDV